MTRGKLKLEPMTNKSARNQTFKKRKSSFFKKISELSTLCGVKACAVIKSCDNTEPDNTEPEFWPSREGVQEVHSEFMKVKETKRFEKMYDQERYLWERIKKEEEKLMKLHAENREIELREVMFDCLKGKKISQHHYHDASFIGELIHLIDGYINQLTHMIQFLKANGEPVPFSAAVTGASGPVVGDVNHVVVGTEGLVSNPTEVYDHMRHYDTMDMSVNEQALGGSNDHVHNQKMNHQEQFQYQTPSNLNLYDQTQPRFYGSSQGMNMNRQDPFQYQTPSNFNLYDQNQPRFYGSSQNMNTGLSHDQGMNQCPCSNQSFMSLLMGQPQQMSDVQYLPSVASMDNNNNRYHQLPITSQIPSTTTTTSSINAAPDLSGHSINNRRWPTRFGLD